MSKKVKNLSVERIQSIRAGFKGNSICRYVCGVYVCVYVHVYVYVYTHVLTWIVLHYKQYFLISYSQIYLSKKIFKIISFNTIEANEFIEIIKMNDKHDENERFNIFSFLFLFFCFLLRILKYENMYNLWYSSLEQCELRNAPKVMARVANLFSCLLLA